MNCPDVVRVLDAIDEAGLTVWVGGGWGVDALLGKETRPHADLDLFVDERDFWRLHELLGTLGFSRNGLVLVYGREPAPTVISLVMSDDSALIDVIPMLLDVDGNGWSRLWPPSAGWDVYLAQELAGTGQIADMPVRCFSPQLQMRIRHRDRLGPLDIRDMTLLAERFGIVTLAPAPPPPLRTEAKIESSGGPGELSGAPIEAP